jgi:hypothetical protein
MGGDDSQKLLPRRGILSPPGRKPPAHYEINTVAENCAMGNSPTPPSPAKASPGRASATDCLGHSWQADLGHSSRAPKSEGLAEVNGGVGFAVGGGPGGARDMHVHTINQLIG